MPAAQLVTSAIEKVANQFLKLDPQSRKELIPLAGKQFKITIDEFPWPLVFAFSESIDVMAIQDDVSVAVDCSIELSLTTLKLLQDSSQITALIQQDKLKLQGDINVAQQFSQLMKNINIDWEEQLSKYTGDVFAHTFFSANSVLKEKFKRDIALLRSTLKDAAIEEKPIAAHPCAVEDFCQQVNELRGDVSRLEARLSILEQQK
jgi:ubiquinone biosynthesis protein UbiJ